MKLKNDINFTVDIVRELPNITKQKDDDKSLVTKPTNNTHLISTPNNVSPIKFFLSNPESKIPTRGTPHSAGLDPYASAPLTIPPHTRSIVHTGLHMKLPFGTYGQIAPRSGLALHKSINIAAGIIDADYRGEILPIIVNNSNTPFQIETGDKIVQLIVVKISMAHYNKHQTYQLQQGGYMALEAQIMMPNYRNTKNLLKWNS